MKLDRVLRPLVELVLKGMYFSWYLEKKEGNIMISFYGAMTDLWNWILGIGH